MKRCYFKIKALSGEVKNSNYSTIFQFQQCDEVLLLHCPRPTEYPRKSVPSSILASSSSSPPPPSLASSASLPLSSLSSTGFQTRPNGLQPVTEFRFSVVIKKGWFQDKEKGFEEKKKNIYQGLNID